MKKIGKILLIVLLANLFSSFVYGGLGDEPRPTSIQPISTLENSTY